MEQWHVMFTNPKKEAFVNGQLQNRGIDTYFPYLQFDRGYGRGIRIEPFFPTYIFFYSDLQSRQAYDLQYMPGVRGLVRFDGRPATVPKTTLEAMQHRLEPLEQRVLKKNELLFKPGDTVLITTGPFEGHEATFEHCKNGQERAQILLKILGAATRTEIAVQHLKTIGTSNHVTIPA